MAPSYIFITKDERTLGLLVSSTPPTPKAGHVMRIFFFESCAISKCCLGSREEIPSSECDAAFAGNKHVEGTDFCRLHIGHSEHLNLENHGKLSPTAKIAASLSVSRIYLWQSQSLVWVSVVKNKIAIEVDAPIWVSPHNFPSHPLCDFRTDVDTPWPKQESDAIFVYLGNVLRRSDYQMALGGHQKQKTFIVVGEKKYLHSDKGVSY